MGRFFARQGPSLYMFYAEAATRRRCASDCSSTRPKHGPARASGAAPDNLFVHPQALHGVLLGVSRESVAWTWSGHPERVRPAA